MERYYREVEKAQVQQKVSESGWLNTHHCQWLEPCQVVKVTAQFQNGKVKNLYSGVC